jgi:hypothetical protein
MVLHSSLKNALSYLSEVGEFCLLKGNSFAIFEAHLSLLAQIRHLPGGQASVLRSQ